MSPTLIIAVLGVLAVIMVLIAEIYYNRPK